MWMSPHIVVFDEPTNSMSWDALVALVAAIKTFKGGVVINNTSFLIAPGVIAPPWIQ